MRCLVASIIATVIVSISGSAVAPHVHAYGDHDHAEHQHGLAAHAHAAAVHHHDDDLPMSSRAVEACEAGAHAVSVAFASVAPHLEHAPVPAAIEMVAFVPALTPLRAVPPADVRTHDPPRLTDGPLRAPPLVIPA